MPCSSARPDNITGWPVERPASHQRGDMQKKHLTQEQAAVILQSATKHYTAQQKSQLEAIRPALARDYEIELQNIDIGDDNYIPYDAGVLAGLHMALNYLFPSDTATNEPATKHGQVK